MEIILVLLGGYLLSKLFNGSSSKPKRRRRKSGFWSSGSSYSEYDAWRKSHGDENKLFCLPYKKEESSRPLAPALKLSIVVNAHLFSNLQTSKGIA